MAKRKSSKPKKAQDTKISPEIGREVVAIALVAVAILLVIAFAGAGGALTAGLLKALQVVMGYVAYTLPLLLLFLAWQLFSGERQYRLANWSGLALTIFSGAGLLHAFVAEDNSLLVAQDGRGGGFFGYLLSRLLLALLSRPAVIIILVALLLIGLVLALNVQFSKLIKTLINRSRSRDDDLGEQLQNRAVGPKINAKVPLVTGQNSPEVTGVDTAPREEPEVLTSKIDPEWSFPSLDLLEDKGGEADAGNPEQNAEIIAKTLANFGIKVAMEEVNIGPTVTQYTFRPEANVKLSKITELANNLELNLAAHPIRIEAPIPGKSAVGIEVPNRKIAIVRLKEILTSEQWRRNKQPLTFSLGKDIAGAAVVTDLANMPHLLIAGATGSGKSIMINSLLMSLLYRHSPAELKLILVDPKRVELKLYEDIPHLLAPVIVDPERCISALKWSVAEMERRYSLFAELGKRNIDEFNAAAREDHMPYIIIIIDELADLMMISPQDVETLIVRIAQKARATGIHLAIATQRPSVNIITGLIKANIPARLAFSTVSQVDSRTIIDQGGAEKLLGRGDMLFLAPDFIKPRRIQGVFVNDKEINAVTNYLRAAREPAYNQEVLTQKVKVGRGHLSNEDWEGGDDSLLNEAARLVIESRKASASLLQRRLRIGYARAARLLDMLEERGVVSAPDGSRPREILVDSLSEAMGADDFSET